MVSRVFEWIYLLTFFGGEILDNVLARVWIISSSCSSLRTLQTFPTFLLVPTIQSVNIEHCPVELTTPEHVVVLGPFLLTLSSIYLLCINT